MEFAGAQHDMVRSQVNGAPGVLVSGLAWVVAGMVWMHRGPEYAFAALFLGGMMIVPGAALISRALFRAPAAHKGNPLMQLGLESTFMLFAGLFLAFAMLHIDPDRAVPVFAVAIGARYFVFRTIYGEWIYWLLGGLIIATGSVAILRIALPAGNTALIVGALELVLSVALLGRWNIRKSGDPALPG